MTLSKMVEVQFQHWYYEFTEDDIRDSSPNKSITTTKQRLRSALYEASLRREVKDFLLLDETQILCANEAFPEAAVADPLADIRIWDEWRSGARIFPYPGKYSRLSITNQPGKTNSTSSVGVIGEILAGLIGQAVVSSDVLVRVIKEWPDFILFPVDGRYSFLEAKAFTPRSEGSLDEKYKIPRDEWAECLVNAVRHLAIDPSIKVWYSFTEIKEVNPNLRLFTRLFELDAPLARRNNYSPNAPDEVIDGLAERAIQMGLAQLINTHPSDLKKLISKERSNQRHEVESKLINTSKEKVESVLSSINYSQVLRVDIKKLNSSIENQVQNYKIPENEAELKYLLKERIEHFQFVRRIGTQAIYRIEIPYDKREEISRTWISDLSSFNQPFTIWKDHKFWRCGSFLFFLCDGEPKTLDEISHDWSWNEA